MTTILKDPRHYQLGVHLALLVYGVAVRAFEITPLQIAAILATALAVQFLGRSISSSASVWVFRSVTNFARAFKTSYVTTPIAFKQARFKNASSLARRNETTPSIDRRP
jgi:AraC-like DNA-binding protein